MTQPASNKYTSLMGVFPMKATAVVILGISASSVQF